MRTKKPTKSTDKAISKEEKSARQLLLMVKESVYTETDVSASELRWCIDTIERIVPHLPDELLMGAAQCLHVIHNKMTTRKVADRLLSMMKSSREQFQRSQKAASLVADLIHLTFLFARACKEEEERPERERTMMQKVGEILFG